MQDSVWWSQCKNGYLVKSPTVLERTFLCLDCKTKGISVPLSATKACQEQGGSTQCDKMLLFYICQNTKDSSELSWATRHIFVWGDRHRQQKEKMSTQSEGLRPEENPCVATGEYWEVLICSFHFLTSTIFSEFRLRPIQFIYLISSTRASKSVYWAHTSLTLSQQPINETMRVLQRG